MGRNGHSLVEPLITPLTKVDHVGKIHIVCRKPGPVIDKIEYHCPSDWIAKWTIIPIYIEVIIMFYFAIFKNIHFVAGYLLVPHGMIAYLVAKLTRKPVIMSLIAGPWEIFFLSHSQKALGTEYKLPLSWREKILLSLLKHTDRILTTGSITKKFLHKCGIDDSVIYPMINPPNLNKYFKVQYKKTIDVISVGALIPIKHHDNFLRTIFLIKKEIPNIKACIVGDGPELQNLILLSNELGLNTNVEFLGHRNDMNNLYNKSKILVHTSEREGFPNVVLEAMACGLPCVISDCGDIIDLAHDGYNSFVIQEYNNCQHFAESIVQLLTNSDMYMKYSKNAIESIEEITTDSLVNSWSQVLSKQEQVKKRN